jgi:hypothetical protein
MATRSPEKPLRTLSAPRNGFLGGFAAETFLHLNGLAARKARAQ